MKTLQNDILSIAVSEHGAELSSLSKAGREYLWQAHPEYWKRHSPVLFPIVGALWNGRYQTHGVSIAMGQHGFARDMEFRCESHNESEVWFTLESDEQTKRRYPFDFRLTIGYRLSGNTVEVIWKVRNTGIESMSFQIGAHPAFHWPMLTDEAIAAGVEAMQAQLNETNKRGWFLLQPKADTVRSSVIAEAGCVSPDEEMEVQLQDGYLPIDTDTFNIDTLILENSQVDTVTLCDDDKQPYITLQFNAPLVGLWSPPRKNAPFVCIEPWYGRTDEVGYNGYFEDRKWMRTLGVGSEFAASYKIIVH